MRHREPTTMNNTTNTPERLSPAGLLGRRFPIMRNHPKGEPQPVESIPWDLIAPHALQAYNNHGQSLERLASRGGLSACEAVAIIEDRSWRKMPADDAATRLAELVSPNNKDGEQKR